MSHDLLVWEGSPPASNREAAEIFNAIMDRRDRMDEEEPPSESIKAFVADLLERWPDLGEEGDEVSPWTAGPLIEEAFGSAICIGMVYSKIEEGAMFILEVAARHDLVCFDPQQECILTSPEA